MEKETKKEASHEPAVEEVIVEEVVSVGPAAAGKKDRFLAISILIAAVLVGGAIVFAALYHPGAPTAPKPPDVMALGARDEILGSVNAPVTLIEYGDYQCPFCSRFFGQTEPQIINDYVNTGKVRMVFRNFAFLGPESYAAAAAAECANDQGKLWPYHDALYQAKLDDEAKGGGENDGLFSRALFLQLASKVGLNIADFTSCIDGNKYSTMVQQEDTAAGTFGVNSTPTFFVNGAQISGAQPYNVFQQAIAAAPGK